MVESSTNYFFSKQRLAELKHSVSIDGNPVLIQTKRDPKYNVNPLQTQITQSKVIPKELVIKEINDLTNLEEKFKFSVYTRKVKKQWYKFQQTELLLVKLPTQQKTLKNFPKDKDGNKSYVEYDIYNKRIRLIGKNAGPMGKSAWINLVVKQSKKKPKFSINDYATNPDKVINRIWETYLPQEEKERIEKIKEIAIMISEDNSLICIPNNRDADTIGIVGKKGCGKTTLINSFVGRTYWKFGGKHIILNDSLNQSSEWALPNNDKYQRMDINKVNEHPMPLPIVPLYPVLGKEKIKMVSHGFKMSMPFDEMFKNYRTFAKGLAHIGLDLDRSEKWFLRLKNEILECKSMDEIKNTVKEAYQETGKKSGKSTDMMIEKINTVLDNLAELNFTDLSSGIPSRWEFDEKKLIPLIGLAEVGLIPALMTNQLSNSYKEFYPSYMQFFINKIIDWQSKNYSKSGRLWLHIDEIGDTYKKGERMSVAGHSVNRLLTQGRNYDIGNSFSIQNYSVLDKEVRNAICYLFTFIYSASEEINAIAKDWDLNKDVKKEIGRLKTHECFAISREDNHPFKVYPFDGEPYETTGVFRGFALPPLSQHKLPSLR